MVSFWYRILTLLLIIVSTSFCRRFPDPDKGYLQKLVDATNDMGLNIYREYARQSKGNFFFSPLILSTVLGKLYYGSQGETAKELRKFLGFEDTNIQDRQVHQTFLQYLANYFPEKDGSVCAMETANTILMNKDLNPLSSYKRGIDEFYDSSVLDIDFMGQMSDVVREANNFIYDHSRGYIDKFLDLLDPSSDLVMLNAVYFKGRWNSRFNTANRNLSTFYNHNRKTEPKQVPMMHIRQDFPHRTDFYFDAFELPYSGKNISMVILLPKKDYGLKYLERKITFARFSTFFKLHETSKIDLTMPMFKLDYSKDMSCTLKILGVRNIFTPTANFSRMTWTPGVFVKHIYQKSIIVVSGDGNEAEVTRINHTKKLDSAAELTVDHPFMFAIIDKRSGMIFFLGRITNME